MQVHSANATTAS